jgi:hypothetical protein
MMARPFLLGTVASFALMAVWAVSMPLYSGPDEPSQVVHAAALVHGQLIGKAGSGYGDPYSSVTVPATFGDGTDLVKCYQFEALVPASCASGVVLSSRPIVAVTYSGRYPPLYFALTGLPTLFAQSTTTVTYMRLVGALACSLLLGLAYMVLAVWSRSRVMGAGFLCALTPMAVYLGSMVNANGLEISAAICTWCAGLVLALEHRDDPPRGLLAVLCGAACVLTLTRGLSPLWTLLILGFTFWLTGPAAAFRLLRSRRDVRWAVGVLVAVGAFATVWVFREHSLWLVNAGPQISPHATLGHIVGEAFGQTRLELEQMVGVLGWNDAYMPTWVYRGWAVAVVLLVVLALRTRWWRGLGALTTLIALTFVAPVCLELFNAKRLGLVWEGRYTLPLAVGIPLMAAAIAGRTAISRAVVIATRGLLVLLAVLGLLGFLETLRRYAVGVRGPLDFLGGRWHPVEGFALAVAWFIAASSLLVLLLWRLSRASREDTEGASAAGPATERSAGRPAVSSQTA